MLNLASVLGTQHVIAAPPSGDISSVVLPAVLHVGVPAVRCCEFDNDIVAAGCRVVDDDDGSSALAPPPLTNSIQAFNHPTTTTESRPK
jgi:hypothetical protein